MLNKATRANLALEITVAASLGLGQAACNQGELLSKVDGVPFALHQELRNGEKRYMEVCSNIRNQDDLLKSQEAVLANLEKKVREIQVDAWEQSHDVLYEDQANTEVREAKSSFDPQIVALMEEIINAKSKISSLRRLRFEELTDLVKNRDASCEEFDFDCSDEFGSRWECPNDGITPSGTLTKIRKKKEPTKEGIY